MAKLKQISTKGEKFYYTFSFDIDDFIGDGIWWLQIYDKDRSLLYDNPYASSMIELDMKNVKKSIIKIIKEKYLTLKGKLI